MGQKLGSRQREQGPQGEEAIVGARAEVSDSEQVDIGGSWGRDKGTLSVTPSKGF